jgi:uncharacterized protein
MHTDREFSKVDGFEWDKANWGKCQKHGLSIDAIESLLRGSFSVFPDPDHSGREERFKAIGRTGDKRHVVLVFTLRKHGSETFIRVISARYMHHKEVAYYEKEAAKIKKR